MRRLRPLPCSAGTAVQRASSGSMHTVVRAALGSCCPCGSAANPASNAAAVAAALPPSPIPTWCLQYLVSSHQAGHPPDWTSHWAHPTQHPHLHPPHLHPAHWCGPHPPYSMFIFWGVEPVGTATRMLSHSSWLAPSFTFTIASCAASRAARSVCWQGDRSAHALDGGCPSVSCPGPARACPHAWAVYGLTLAACSNPGVRPGLARPAARTPTAPPPRAAPPGMAAPAHPPTCSAFQCCSPVWLTMAMTAPFCDRMPRTHSLAL